MRTHEDNVNLSALKFGVEQILFGIIPDVNIKGSGQYTDWCRYLNVDHQILSACPSDTLSNPNTEAAENVSMFDIYHIEVKTPTIETAGLEIMGAPLYRDLPIAFYEAYQPFVFEGFGGELNNGVGLMNFSLGGRKYQAAGVLNLSRMRDVAVKYKLAERKGKQSLPAQFICESIAINFTIVLDGTISPRFSA